MHSFFVQELRILSVMLLQRTNLRRMGDVEGAQEYLKQFGRAGGDWKALKEVMDRETAFREELIADFENELKKGLKSKDD